MVEEKNGSPYNTKESAGNGALFYGRETIFPWIQAALLQAVPESGPQHPVILAGPRHIGKTSILKQIEDGKLNPPYTALYINLADLATNGVSEFLWGIATTAVTQLNKRHIDLQPLKHAQFVGDPFNAFREQLLLPATVALKETHPVTADGRASGKLLFLFDNLQALIQPAQPHSSSADIFKELHNQIYKNHLAACLFTYENSADPLPETGFNDAQIYEVGPLSTEATIEMVRQPVPYKIFKNVAEYIASLTQNKPYETQLICQALYQRQQNLNLGFITVADVKAVHYAIQDSQQHYSEFNKESPIFQISKRSSSFQTIHRGGRPAFWQQRRFLGILLLLLIATAVITAVPTLTAKSWPAHIAGLGGDGSSPQQIPTFSAPATAQIVVIVESPTPQPTATLTLTPAASASPRPSATATPSNTPTITPTPKPTILAQSFTRQLDQMPMHLIPSGSFMMGSEDNDFEAGLDERPLHEVFLDTFYMDQYEVSVDQYTTLLNRLGTYKNSCDRFDCISPRNVAGFTTFMVEEDLGDGTVQYNPVAGYGDYPMNHVSWYGASVYCQFVGGRLPTEAEWEYAARSSDGRLFPWGNNPPNPERAIYQSESFENLKPVDALPAGASPFGLYAMAGSVWEWTADWYDESYYAESPSNNPAGPENGINKVIRGGGWPNNNERDRIRSANRSTLAPDFFSSTTGFRCAYDP